MSWVCATLISTASQEGLRVWLAENVDAQTVVPRSVSPCYSTHLGRAWARESHLCSAAFLHRPAGEGPQGLRGSELQRASQAMSGSETQWEPHQHFSQQTEPHLGGWG